MPDSTTTFTYYDPSRCFEGTPYEAAAKAVQQSRNVLGLLVRSLEDTDVQARNAYMTRRLDSGEVDPDAGAWEGEPEASALRRILRDLETLDIKLSAIKRAAAYDPKNPPTEEAA